MNLNLQPTQTTINQWIHTRRAQLQQLHSQHQQTLVSLGQEKQQLQSAIAQLQTKEEQLQNLLSHEIRQSTQSSTHINELTSRQSSLQSEIVSLRSQVDQLLAQVSSKREQLQQIQQGLSKNQEKDFPELVAFELLLGLKITGVQDDVLRFTFINITNEDKEYSLLLNVSEEQYKVEGTNPTIENTKLETILTELNDSRDLTQFLKSMRDAFKSLMTE